MVLLAATAFSLLSVASCLLLLIASVPVAYAATARARAIYAGVMIPVTFFIYVAVVYYLVHKPVAAITRAASHSSKASPEVVVGSLRQSGCLVPILPPTSPTSVDTPSRGREDGSLAMGLGKVYTKELAQIVYALPMVYAEVSSLRSHCIRHSLIPEEEKGVMRSSTTAAPPPGKGAMRGGGGPLPKRLDMEPFGDHHEKDERDRARRRERGETAGGQPHHQQQRSQQQQQQPQQWTSLAPPTGKTSVDDTPATAPASGTPHRARTTSGGPGVRRRGTGQPDGVAAAGGGAPNSTSGGNARVTMAPFADPYDNDERAVPSRRRRALHRRRKPTDALDAAAAAALSTHRQATAPAADDDDDDNESIAAVDAHGHWVGIGSSAVESSRLVRSAKFED